MARKKVDFLSRRTIHLGVLAFLLTAFSLSLNYFFSGLNLNISEKAFEGWKDRKESQTSKQYEKNNSGSSKTSDKGVAVETEEERLERMYGKNTGAKEPSSVWTKRETEKERLERMYGGNTSSKEPPISQSNSGGYYRQNQGEWAGIQVTPEYDFSQVGCGPTVVADLMIQKGIGKLPNNKPVNPYSIYEYFFRDDSNGLIGYEQISEALSSMGIDLKEDRSWLPVFANNISQSSAKGVITVTIPVSGGVEHWTIVDEVKPDGYWQLQDPYYGKMECRNSGSSLRCRGEGGKQVNISINGKWSV